MKKALAIPALGLLCLVAMAGGITIAVGPDAALNLVGLGPGASSSETSAPLDTHAAENDAESHGTNSMDDRDALEKDPAKMPVMPFPEIIVNVTDTASGGRQTSRFLKLNMLMVYDDTQEGAERLVNREIYLRDTFQDFLRQLHVSDLQGSHGLAMMKTELLRRARAVGHTQAPVEILIADMVVQ